MPKLIEQVCQKIYPDASDATKRASCATGFETKVVKAEESAACIAVDGDMPLLTASEDSVDCFVRNFKKDIITQIGEPKSGTKPSPAEPGNKRPAPQNLGFGKKMTEEKVEPKKLEVKEVKEEEVEVPEEKDWPGADVLKDPFVIELESAYYFSPTTIQSENIKLTDGSQLHTPGFSSVKHGAWGSQSIGGGGLALGFGAGWEFPLLKSSSLGILLSPKAKFQYQRITANRDDLGRSGLTINQISLTAGSDIVFYPFGGKANFLGIFAGLYIGVQINESASGSVDVNSYKNFESSDLTTGLTMNPRLGVRADINEDVSILTGLGWYITDLDMVKTYKDIPNHSVRFGFDKASQWNSRTYFFLNGVYRF